MDEATDEETYHDQAVMDSKEQHENVAANSNNDIDDDHDTPLKPLCHVMKLSRPRSPSRNTLKLLMNLMHTSWRAFWWTLLTQLSSLTWSPRK